MVKHFWFWATIGVLSYLEVVVEHLLAVEQIGAGLAQVAQVDLEEGEQRAVSSSSGQRQCD